MDEGAAEAQPSRDDTSRIRRLPENVINRIAAGEVVVRPSAALKELLENSLDADAKSITITVRHGGLKLLQVSDDGKGISREDLPLLCQRFATSKLRTFDELASVSTFGFRGEALASISHVSRLSVLTKTNDSAVAYKAAYLDGVLRGDPEPTAGCCGTTIIIEDMFYNLFARRNALKSASDEYRAVVDVVSRYAIRYPKVAFICRRSQTGNSSRGVAPADVRTELCSSVKDNIRAAFGSSVANELLSFEVNVPQTKATVSAYVSSANFSMKKAVFILFINGRLVECQPFKRAVLASFACFLPKSGHPFVYLDLRMKQTDIDVNVHPTKKEVRFLNDQIIIETVVEKLIDKLKTTETSRTFLAQAIISADRSRLRAALPNESGASLEPQELQLGAEATLVSDAKKSASQGVEASAQATQPPDISDEEIPDIPNSPLQSSDSPDLEVLDVDAMSVEPVLAHSPEMKSQKENLSVNKESNCNRPSSKSKNVYAKDKVRTGSNAPVGLFDMYLSGSNESSHAFTIHSWRKRRPNAIPLLTSIQRMLTKCQNNAHRGLSEVLKEHTYVGVASDKFVLLQHATKLMLAETDPILMELMYQQALIRFADHEIFRLEPPAPVVKLVEAYAQHLDDQEKRSSAESCVASLIEKAPMLSEYFGISFIGSTVAGAEIGTLPLLFPGVMPDMNYFGAFLYHLAVDTDWSEESACLNGISKSLAEWYGKHWIPASSGDDAETIPQNGSQKENVEDAQASASAKKSPEPEESRREWFLRHVLFASLRKDFYPPQRFYTQKIIREITSTGRLYKVFERC